MAWLNILNFLFSAFFGFGDLPVIMNSGATVVNLRPDSPAAPWPQESVRHGAVLVSGDRLFLFLNRADEAQPIASITKLMTALVFLDNNPGWDEVYQIKPEDNIQGGKINLFLGELVRVKDLFYTSLIASDNVATIALVRSTGLSEEQFVAQMNAKALDMGLKNTNFSDPIGLSADNTSTAREVALLAEAAFKKPEILSASANQDYQFETLNGRKKMIESTDDLLFVDSPAGLEVLGGKTGYTDEAGYCYVGYMRGPSGKTVISVVLGAKGRNDRFQVSRDIAEWVLSYYDWSNWPALGMGRKLN